MQAMTPGVDGDAIRATLQTRYEAARSVLETSEASAYLARQLAFTAAQCTPELDELTGVCDGFGLARDHVFALMHLSILKGRFEIDGCTAWARKRPEGGALLCKNRDLSGPHRNGQAVFLHEGADIAGSRMVCLGTLGAPGAYSSGMNAAGLAMADTAITAPRHGIGWLRYLLMTRILSTCTTVADALALIAATRHAGGGSLILADAAGETAAVELHAEGARIEFSDPAFRTNHFWTEPETGIAQRVGADAWRSTSGRKGVLEQALASGLGLGGFDETVAVMADHGDEDREALCRHGGADGSHTVSCVVYDTRQRSITFSRSAPCEGAWESMVLESRTPPEAATP
jgi:hypothetical protein